VFKVATGRTDGKSQLKSAEAGTRSRFNYILPQPLKFSNLSYFHGCFSDSEYIEFSKRSKGKDI